MARRIGLGGPGELIVNDPDPLEVALKRAQLEDLLQRPQTERAQLALAQMQEGRLRDTAASAREFDTFKANLAKQQAIESGDIDRAKLIEEQTRTKDTRAYQQGSLAEDTRFHTGQLGETKATREANVTEAREKVRAGLVSDVLAHYTGREGVEGTGVPAGATSAIAAKLGFPELGAGGKEAAALAEQTRAAALAKETGGTKPVAAAAPAPTGPPGYNLSGVTKYAPIGLANFGVGMSNEGLAGINTLTSLVGIPPLPRVKKFPYDWQAILKGQRTQ